MMDTLTWTFPLPRTHTGILLGNAVTGLMIWGEGSQLNITLGRADLWDHRGGMPWQDAHNYQDIYRLLENNDQEGLMAIFTCPSQDQSGQPERPSLIPVGRLELDLGVGALLTDAVLHFRTGCCAIHYTRDSTPYTLSLCLDMKSQRAAVTSDETSVCKLWRIHPCPYYDLNDDLKTLSFEAPSRYESDIISGWYQKLPVDDGIGVYFRESDNSLFIANGRSESDALQVLEASDSFDTVASETAAWWTAYWADIPKIITPDDELNDLYAYGMYKFAGFSQPDGIAGGLQGPWIEDYTLPPWSADYHFNINLQMCYGPAYKSGKLDHLKPLFDMIFSWEDSLRENAKKFIGIEDGFLLPHAVDDRATCMGGFWTGCIDHACTAWVADMMWAYVDYTGDVVFLDENVLPFMTGAMRVYEEMLEWDGDVYSLPLSVSPEYRGSEMNAWGANASFQLAAIHRLLEDIQLAHQLLSTDVKESFLHIAEHLPKATLLKLDGRTHIALWEGMDLEESHRHHSHLAALCPFDVIDWEDPEWIEIVSASINHWIGKGMGLWSGWCMPWASMIHSRLDNGDGAKLILDIWKQVFVNEGHGTLHDANISGLSLLGAVDLASRSSDKRHEIMQLDAGFGVVTAIQDMMVHSRRGVIHIFAGVPARWKFCSFGPMPCGGGFSVSASRAAGSVTDVTVTASREGICSIKNPVSGDIESLELAAGESRSLVLG